MDSSIMSNLAGYSFSNIQLIKESYLIRLNYLLLKEEDSSFLENGFRRSLTFSPEA